MKKTVYLYLGDLALGTLTIEPIRGHETYLFQYDATYIDSTRPMLDPDIANVRGPQFATRGGLFGFLADVAPDRWGRRLIRRREKRNLMESDFLLGVCDLTRQGALRLKLNREGPFVAENLGDAAPPWTTLRQLECAARHIDAETDERVDERWIQQLFQPGSSLGGARPKANVTAPDGSIWIAKFPSVKDEWDVGAREYQTSLLARKVGINVPPTECHKLSKVGSTFFSKRFDRFGDQRIHYASAMTMLGAKDGEEDNCYLEIAEFLSTHSANATEDLQELWRRIAFSQLINNTDDHLRNHGFLLTPKGWRLAPMFDVNPNPLGGESVLDKGDIINDADFYRLTKREAQARFKQMEEIIRSSHD